MEVAMRYVITGIIGLVLSFSTAGAQTSRTPLEARDNNTSPAATQLDATMLRRSIGVVLDSSEGGIVITNVYVSMPAYNAGLCKGDRLLSINRRPVTSLRQAVEQTQNIPMNVIMLDVQRRDMRICRRVDVRDGRPQHIGSYKDGRTLALAITRFADGTSDELFDLTKRFTPGDLDTVILDMRNNSGGSRYEAQKIARMLSGSQHSGRNDLKVIILRESTSSSAVDALADIMVQQRDAEIWASGLNTTMHIDPSISGIADQQQQKMRELPTLASDMESAPVHWNMADFRERYPEPSPAATMHPLMMAHTNAPPIAWGINGNAWAAMERVRGARD
jgi:hypothetical protein